MRTRALLAAALGIGLAACRTPVPTEEVEVGGLETYWAIDSAVGQTQYLAPCARFLVRNKKDGEQHSVQATATFRRKGEEGQTWGADWRQVATTAKPLGARQQSLVVLKSDARYYSTGAPESMFDHKLFRDARVEVFVKVGSSGWVKMGEAAIERRIGSKSIDR
jgi:hypothetical protein